MPHPIPFLAAILSLSFCSLVPTRARGADEPPPSTGQRFFEMRTYTTAEGRLDALHDRFRNHTNALFKKHGIEIIGFWTPAEGPLSKNTLIYVVAYPSKEARDKSWEAFQADPDWQKAKADSEKDGKIVIHVDSVYMNPTDYSPIR